MMRSVTEIVKDRYGQLHRRTPEGLSAATRTLDAGRCHPDFAAIVGFSADCGSWQRPRSPDSVKRPERPSKRLDPHREGLPSGLLNAPGRRGWPANGGHSAATEGTEPARTRPGGLSPLRST